jgi:hypothetical protein
MLSSPNQFAWESVLSDHYRRSGLEATMVSFDRILYELQDEIPALQLADGIAALCDATSCSQKLPSGELMYADHIHLSAAGGRYFARSSGWPT